MKIDLSIKEREIIKKALTIRVQELSQFSRECETKGHKECMRQFIEMANDADAVLEKFYELDKEK